MDKRGIGLVAGFLGAISGCRMVDGGSLKAQDPSAVSWVEGHATNFEALGEPYGGCGVPQSELEWPHFVALNVQHTPREYIAHLRRPIEDDAVNGAWDRGRNCGRFIRVELTDTCIDGANSGAAGTEFCAGGRYGPDAHNGATLDFLVTDSCQDGNLWCRDDRYHVDLSTASLKHFKKDGATVPDLLPGWANRKVRWRYIDAPNYTGDIQIAFIKKAEKYWPAIAITHLERGIHGVEAEVNGQWQRARMIGDNGQAYELPPSPTGSFKIRVIDAHDELINGGRVYSFQFPCDGVCGVPFTKVTYQTLEGSDRTSASSDAAPQPQPQPQAQPQPQPQAHAPAPAPAQPQPGSTQPSNPAGGAPLRELTATLRPKTAWQDGYCVDIVLHNTGKSTIQGWTLVLKAGAAVIDQTWNIDAARSGDHYVVKPSKAWAKAVDAGRLIENVGFCAKLPAGGQAATVLEVRR
jgi:hypothetical protein